jgi:hypothetical protein
MQLRNKYGDDWERIGRMSIIEEAGGTKSVRMAYLAVVASHSVNGVAAIHSEIIKETIFKDFYDVSVRVGVLGMGWSGVGACVCLCMPTSEPSRSSCPISRITQANNETSSWQFMPSLCQSVLDVCCFLLSPSLTRSRWFRSCGPTSSRTRPTA